MADPFAAYVATEEPDPFAAFAAEPETPAELPVGTPMGFGLGVGKGALRTVRNLAGLSPVLAPAARAFDDTLEPFLEPGSQAQRAGMLAEGMAEWAIPAGMALKTVAGPGARLLGKGLQAVAKRPSDLWRAPVQAAGKALERAGGGGFYPATTKAAATVAPKAAAAKPHLTAKEAAAMLRSQYGSEKAGRMLWGSVQRQAEPGSRVASATARKEGIKTLAPMESQLPTAAKGKIAEALKGMEGGDAFAYASQAPNDLAREHFGDLLRQALIDQMRRR